MTSRRRFLQIGLAASALPIAGNVFAGATAPTVAGPTFARLALFKVLFDGELAAGRAFGEEAARRGASVYAIQKGDVTDFWFNDLDLRWRDQPVAIAGMTKHGPLFIFEQLARDRGLRVVFRAEHVAAGTDSILHRITGPEASLGAAAALPGAGGDWSSSMAGLVTQCAADCRDKVSHTLVTPAQAPGNDTLYSWVIAPRA
jgi:hypothetical protein